MTYTGFENHSVEELVGQIEHEGPSRATAELLKRIEELQEAVDGQQELVDRIETLEEEVRVAEEARDEWKDKYESLNELLQGEAA